MGGNTHRCETMGGSVGGKVDRPSYRWAIVIMFLEYAGWSATLSVLPKLETEFFGANAILVSTIAKGFSGFMQFFLSPIVGSLSDRYGRKPFLVLSVICMGGSVSALLFTHNMWVYAGLTATLGSCAITLPLTSAYVADVTERHERASALGMLLCMMGLSFIFGPLLGASVYHKLGWEALFALPATTTTLNALYVGFVLPESNVQRAEDRAPISWSRRTIVDMVTGPVRLVTASKFYGRIALISLLLNLVLFGFITTFQFYFIAAFQFTPFDLALYIANYGVLEMLGNGLLVRWLVRCIRVRTLLILGCTGHALYMFFVGIGSVWWVMFAAQAFCVLSSTTNSSLMAYASNMAGDEQGKIIGVVNSVKGICMGIAPVLFGSLVRGAQHTSAPGSPYLLAALLAFLSVLVSSSLPCESAEQPVAGPVIEVPDASVDDGIVVCVDADEETALLQHSHTPASVSHAADKASPKP